MAKSTSPWVLETEARIRAAVVAANRRRDPVSRWRQIEVDRRRAEEDDETVVGRLSVDADELGVEGDEGEARASHLERARERADHPPQEPQGEDPGYDIEELCAHHSGPGTLDRQRVDGDCGRVVEELGVTALPTVVHQRVDTLLDQGDDLHVVVVGLGVQKRDAQAQQDRHDDDDRDDGSLPQHGITLCVRAQHGGVQNKPSRARRAGSHSKCVGALASELGTPPAATDREITSPLGVEHERQVAIGDLHAIGWLRVLREVVWFDPPKWASAAIFVGFGSMALLVAPQVVAAIGVPATALMILGAVFSIAGAVVYGIQWPDPIPAVLGYDEVFHAFVIAGAAAHFAAIALYIIPDAPRA